MSNENTSAVVSKGWSFCNPLRDSGVGSPAGNSVLPQLAVPCRIEAECYYQTSVQIDREVLRNRQLLKPANR